MQEKLEKFVFLSIKNHNKFSSQNIISSQYNVQNYRTEVQ